ncbi:NapC/NirT family cytochrome c [Myxococcota bacterium]|nr:NapC/NirT family cytochrome c [Myxococcota bacterium]
MLRRFFRLIRVLSIHWLGGLGVTLTTLSFVLFVALELLRLLGVLTNAYLGLITYMTLPAFFVLGLLVIPVGWWRLRKRTGKSSRALLNAKLDAQDLKAGFFGTGVGVTLLMLTLLNALFLGGGTVRMLRFMETPAFCGTACHVMAPEWAAYQDSPHARVACVRCHVGESAEAQVEAKLNGLRQMVSLMSGHYTRPIPTPVHQMRHSQETCQGCHWIGEVYGDRLKLKARFGEDAASTPSYTTLSLKVGHGKPSGARGAHWHAQADVRYASIDGARDQILWVESTDAQGQTRRWRNAAAAEGAEGVERRMDCVDCHNRVAHTLEGAEAGVDRLISDGALDRHSLPHLKREALSALTRHYEDEAAAMAGIEQQLHGHYRRDFPDVYTAKDKEIASAVTALQALYRRNVFPAMNITWGTYPSRMGHRDAPGCDRCHSRAMIDEAGRWISDDCGLCHDLLAQESPEPFQFMMPASEGDPDQHQKRWHQALYKRSLR